jgi:predicted RNA binding protein YcfA (HicA-like mRNA interferase family)
MSAAKVLQRVLSGTSDASIRFQELCSLLEALGFDKRIRGSHHLFRKAGVEEKINPRWEPRQALPGQTGT